MKIIENSECLIGFGRFVRAGRENKGISQQEVADHIGISQVYYSQIERGIRNTDLVMALKICQELKLNLNEYIKEYLD